MDIGRSLMAFGALVFCIGLIWSVGRRFGLGELPGDLLIKRENWSLYFPFASSLVLSILASLVLWLLKRGGS